MLGFFAACAWIILIIGWIGFSIDHAKASARQPKEEQEKITAGDLAALPGIVMYFLLPFGLVGGFLYLLAQAFL